MFPITIIQEIHPNTKIEVKKLKTYKLERKKKNYSYSDDVIH